MSTTSLSKKDLQELHQDIYAKADRFIACLLTAMFLFGIGIAFFYDTWWIALGIGGPCVFAYFIAKALLPESNWYQYVLSSVCTIFSAQYVYQMHGMAEMHSWLFICSTILIVYQNWRLQIPILLIVYVYHGTCAWLQYSGYKDVYFTTLEYMDLTTFLFHIALVTGVCLASGFWSYRINKRTLQDARNFKVLSSLQDELRQNTHWVDRLNQDLLRVNKDIKEKNEELQTSGEQLRASEAELKRINEKLNQMVAHRTQALNNQNKKLLHYAFINAHKVRSPLARIMGLVTLIGHEIELSGKGNELLKHLDRSATELDDILKEVRTNLEEAEFKE